MATETHADQRGNDVMWMTAAERDAYDARLKATEDAIRAATGSAKPYVMSIDERGGVTVRWWWQ